jgi:hypothetical protein
VTGGAECLDLHRVRAGPLLAELEKLLLREIVPDPEKPNAVAD